MKKKTIPRILSLKKKTIIQLNSDQEIGLVGGITPTRDLSCLTNCVLCPAPPITQNNGTTVCLVSCNNPVRSVCGPCV
ncbi:hypothetical protein B0I18_103241 [Taibaiella chishuiensis]|uniref:Uncharacterized protein n=1 Tax=Taibaiella chishuiensis TaxID=1434707 RepID=A0A2P8D621_9BACT|nr:hypothetical protein B0I18_103241 [Taibaiella chishuiensis]